jgi:hypothetical protein
MLVREGGGGSNYTIPDTIANFLRVGWDSVLREETGYQSYQEMREDLSFLKKKEKAIQ